jgi:hypothetical protein
MATTIIKNKTPLGLTLPIRNGGIGFFEQTFEKNKRRKSIKL